MVSDSILQNKISSDIIRKICLEMGVDDVGFVEIERVALGSVQQEVLSIYPKTKTIISICIRTNPENVQGVSRSLANEEFHKTYDELSINARKIVRRLNEIGIRALSCHPTFPMDTDRWAGKIWEISHKPIAEQAGIGKIGINRMVLHPKFGTHILLDSILIDSELDTYGKPLDSDPCISCRLCVSACPVGAIDAKKGIDFNACMTHNYRDFMGGFEDWVENIVSSKNVKEFRKKSGDDENVSKWQSLSFGPQYKAAYCVSVCPAGTDLIGIFDNDKPSWVKQIVKPLKDKKEPVYVGENTRAEEFARKNSNKEIKIVKNVQHPKSINGFLSGSRVSFEPKHARGVNLTVHFQFNGSQTRKATIKIENGLIDVAEDHVGKADLTISTDSETWLKIVNKETSFVSNLISILSGRVKVNGKLKLLKQFQNCFVGQ
ncbi:MAG: 4Fe-4S binding protein [Candidatus Nitrosopelagicus sp.]|jgi:epoxyqueuosine reductase QueG|nr:4Fe-4S binding protein [Candidatus Nitrosopelagicus sp.]